MNDGSSILRSEDKLQLPRFIDLHVLALVLVSIGVSTNHDGVSPSGDEAGDVLTDDGLTEYGTIQYCSDRTIGGWPHLLQLELNDSSLISCDCSTLNTHLMLLYSICRVECNLD
jgi:hypothetical protein